MVCMVEVSQQMLKLLHRALLLLEEALEMPCVGPACLVGLALLVVPMHVCWHLNSSP